MLLTDKGFSTAPATLEMFGFASVEESLGASCRHMPPPAGWNGILPAHGTDHNRLETEATVLSGASPHGEKTFPPKCSLLRST